MAGYGTSVLTVGNGNASGSFAGTIQNSTPNGAVALVKTGSGTQYLSLANIYAGGTTLTGGVLNFSTSALGTGSITFNGGTLQYAAGNTQDVSAAIAAIAAGQAAAIDTNGNTVAFGAGLSGAGGLTKLGAGMLTLNAANNYFGTTTDQRRHPATRLGHPECPAGRRGDGKRRSPRPQRQQRDDQQSAAAPPRRAARSPTAPARWRR